MSRKLVKKQVAAIITVVAVASVITALLIINIFYPLKYFAALIVVRKRSPQGQLTFHVLDVGQSDCAIAELPDGKTMLIDGGDGTYKNTLKILKALNRLDISYIDYVICTSVSEDCCGGLSEILKYKQAGTIFYPYCLNKYITESFYEFYKTAQSCGAQMVISEYGAGAESEDGAFYLTFLSPGAHDSESSEYYELNSDPSASAIKNASAVIWIEYAGRGIFYASEAEGDILDGIAENYNALSEQGEEYVYEYFSFGGHLINLSDCAIYKVSDHGSSDGACTQLIDLLKPDISVISVGESNTEGCPSVSVMADLAAYGEIYLTQYQGDIKISITADGVLDF